MKLIFGLLVFVILIGASGYFVLAPQFGVNLGQISLDQVPATAKSLRDNFVGARAITIATEPLVAKKSNGIDLLSVKGEIDCFLCHDAALTKGFHVPEKIIKIEATKDKRRRVCVDCHGADGANADVQMTDPKSITFDIEAGMNGLFRLSPDVPHVIHRKKLIGGNMECGACHLTDYSKFDIFIPKADEDKGQVLLCQNCKFHPEGGNYIAIHVEVSGFKCTVCHTGNMLKIHQEATSKLGGGVTEK